MSLTGVGGCAGSTHPGKSMDQVSYIVLCMPIGYTCFVPYYRQVYSAGHTLASSSSNCQCHRGLPDGEMCLCLL